MIEVQKQGEKEYVFFLKSKSGQTLLKGTSYKTEREVHDAIKSLYSLVFQPNLFQRKTDHSGYFLFDLKNIDGKLLGSSQLYNSEAGLENGIKNLKKRVLELSNS